METGRLKSLIYISLPNRPFNHSALQKLAEHSATKNRANDITGFLSFQDNMFLQYLEGESLDLGNLLAKLAMDNRHTIVNTLYNDEDHPRRFSQWNMQYVDENFIEQHSVEAFLGNQLQLMREQALCDKHWQQLIWQGVDILANKVRTNN